RFSEQAFDGPIPSGGSPGPEEQALAAEVADAFAELRRCHEAREFRRAAALTRALWARANAYLQSAAPWTALKSDRERAAVITRTALELVRLGAIAAWSIVPHLAEAALRALGEPDGLPAWPTDAASDLLSGRRAGRVLAGGGPLVEKIDAAAAAR